MAFRFCDSMAHYNMGSNFTVFTRKWTVPGNFNTWNSSGGRRNAPFLTLIETIARTLTPTSTWILGGAFNQALTQSTPMLAAFNGGTPIVYVRAHPDMTLSIVAGSNTIFTSVQAIEQAQWNYIELAFTLSGGTGTLTASATLQVNNQVWGSATGASNIVGANLTHPGAFANQVGVFIDAGTLGGFQDFYALDNSTTDINGNASTNTTFLGDVEVDALFPDQDITTGWGTFGGDGTHVFSCVNESIPDDDTSYVITSNTGSSEAFKYTPISGFTGTICAAQYLVCAKKDNEGQRNIAMTVGTSTVASLNFATTTGSNTSTSQALNDYYIYYIAPLDTDNGVAWTTGVFNTETFGVTLTT